MSLRILHGLRCLVCGLTIVGVSLVGRSASAANNWDSGGADSNWGTAGNWDNDAVPVFPAPVIFGTGAKTSPNNNLSNPTVRGITFSAGATSSFSVGGGGITLTPSIQDEGT